jgi:serine/threonine-protein kinase
MSTQADHLFDLNAAGDRAPEAVGPYLIFDRIGSGGMAAVHLGVRRNASVFARVVAVKRMHQELAGSPEFVEMFLQEARLAARIAHPNVVAALDCVVSDETVLLVMEYVHGVSLSAVAKREPLVPAPIASAIVTGVALGLHAAHEASDPNGVNLGLVHRDVSPHNILVGVDGLARVLDFGIAKAAARVHHTRTGEIKGKVRYMAPEQLLGEEVGREADVYALGVVLWELFTGRRLFAVDEAAAMMMRIASHSIASPRSVNPQVSPAVEAIIMKALSRSPKARHRTALELATALERAAPPAGQRVVGDWIARVAADELRERAAVRSRVDRASAALGMVATDEVPARFTPVTLVASSSGRAPASGSYTPNPSTAVSQVAVIRHRSRWRQAALLALVAACTAAGGWGLLAARRPKVPVRVAVVWPQPPEPRVSPDSRATVSSPPDVAATASAPQVIPVTQLPIASPRAAEGRGVEASHGAAKAHGWKPAAGRPVKAASASDAQGEPALDVKAEPAFDTDLRAIGGRQ